MPDQSFTYLDVRVVPASEGYLAMAESSYGGDYRRTFVGAVDADELARFQASVLSEPGREIHPPGSAPTGSSAELAAAIGDALFEALFAGELRHALSETEALARRDGRDLRVRLRLDAAPDVAALPWELLRDPDRGRHLCLSSRTQVVRHLAVPEARHEIRLSGPLRILGLIASPTDLAPLAAEREWAALEQGLDELVRAGSVELRRVEPPTIDQLSRELIDGPWHVFHFIGHGLADPPSVALCDVHGRSRLVTADSLAVTLTDSRELRLAVLNTCHGASAATRGAAANVATALVRNAVPTVVAMQFTVSDRAAVAFAARFYAGIGHGLGVDTAVGEARKALHDLGAEWATPVVYLRGEGVVFDPDPEVEPRRPRHRRRRLLTGVVAAAAVAATATALLVGDGDGDDEGSDATSKVTVGRDVALPEAFEERASIERICYDGGDLVVTAGPARAADGIITVPVTARAAGLNTETNFEPLQVLDRDGTPFREAELGGFREWVLDQDGADAVTSVAADVRVNAAGDRDVSGVVLVVRGECVDGPLVLGVAVPG